MSYPPSGSSSLAPSRSHTPLPPTANIPAAAHHLHTTTLTHKLRHMFDAPRHATFAAQVVIHELTNIPQLDGEFAVQWKFRGKRPKHDAVRHPVEKPRVEPGALAGAASRGGVAAGSGGARLAPKPSLPNLKLQQPSHSTVSLRSTSTTSTTSTAPSPLTPMQPRSLLPPAHANSLRQTSMPAASSSSSVPSLKTARADKKPSDPTPLRQSVGPDNDSQPQLIMEEPEEVASGLGAVKDTPPPTTASAPILTAGESSSNSGSSRNSLDSSRQPRFAGPADGGRTPYAASTGHLGVPFPRSTSLRPATLPPARSGTMPSPAIITGSVPGTDDVDLERARPRAQSRASSRSASSSRAPDARPRSLTSSSSTTGLAQLARNTTHTAHSSVHRKGATPPSALSTHTVSFEYEIQHIIKVPLGKPVPLSGTATPSSSRPREASRAQLGTAPILGAGPMSDSGLKLTILQVHRAAAKDGDSDGDSKHSVLGRELDRVKEKEKEREDRKSIYGWVDIDLAPFAGLGPTTRKFLLKDSKTNATVRITVEMHWIGGEERWAAPPLHEGHHATGIKDLTGSEAADNVRSDLHLHQSPSRSSGSDLSSLSAQASTSNVSGRSGPSSAPSNNLSRNQSSISLVHPGPQQLGYKTYEHHLKEGPASADPPNSPFLTIPLGARARSPSPSQFASRHARALSPGLSPGGHSRRPSHRHHTHHLRDSTHHLHGRDPETEAHGHELPPEFVVEAVFNPRPAEMETPFTYLPQGSGSPMFGHDVFGAGGGAGAGDGPLGAVAEPPSPHDGDEAAQPQPGTRRGWGKLRMRVASGAKERSYVGRTARVGGDD